MNKIVDFKTYLKIGVITFGLFGAVTLVQARSTSQVADGSYIYTVQPEETLLMVALRYNVLLTELMLANPQNFSQPIFMGQSLKIPNVSPPTSPIPAEALPLRAEYTVQAGDSLADIAARFGVALGSIMIANDLSDPDLLQVGQILEIPEGPPVSQPLVAPFAQIILSEPTIIQGRSLVVKVRLAEPATLSGQFEGRPLFFDQDGNGQWWSIIAIHALTEPNVYPIRLTATRPDGSVINTLTKVTVEEGAYETENIELDAARGELLTNELIEREREMLAELWSQVTPTPRWSGPFRLPVSGQPQFTSPFGTRRSYNGSPVTSFHGGTDFAGEVGTPIYAAAPGTVVMAESLPLRGNAVLIDHGMGLFSGYWHQTQLVVTAGQEVQTGQVLGYLGSTGLVTGPHLHWEIRLQGFAVEPMQWVQQTIP
jgi:murein DD-endopeptidase MepM/ murein hydrolase activator NlpD